MQVNNYKAYLQLEKNLKQFQGLNIGFVFCTVIIFSAGFILSMLLISLDGTNLLTVASSTSNIKYLSKYLLMTK